MIKRRTAMIITLMLGVFSLSATTAFAEFESKEMKGKGEGIELTIEGGGGKVVCKAFTEGASKVGWTIEKEGKASTKGSGLLVNIETWGECTAESAKLKNIKAEISECEIELKEPKSETEVSARVVKECTITAAICKIKIAPKENENLNTTNLASAGAENENLMLEPAVKNLAFTVSGICGIESTKEGKISGWAEQNLVQPAVRSEFSLSPSLLRFNAGMKEGTIKVKNVGAEQKPGAWARLAVPGGSFSSNAAEEKTCETKMYKPKEKCEFKIKWELAGLSTWIVGDKNGVKAEVTVRGQ